MLALNNMLDCDLHHKRVVIREDFNVPLKNGKVENNARIKAALPTLQALLKENAGIIILSHLGRPQAGAFDQALSLAPVADELSQLLSHPVKLVTDDFTTIKVTPGEIILCENVRFLPGEKENDRALAESMASMADLFVMDAFAVAHRQHASTAGIAEFAKEVAAGPLLVKELTALDKAQQNPRQPVLAIVGGAKISTKLTLIEALSKKASQLIVGGGILNTFIKASGINIGKSLYEPDLLSTARELLGKVDIPLPEDVVIADSLSTEAKAEIVEVNQVPDDAAIFDVGPKTAAHFAQLVLEAGTIIWNGPLGVFEYPQFASGTEVLAKAIAKGDAFSLAGGGDTVSAVETFNIQDKLSYVSTGGGAFLKAISGEDLPAVSALMARC